jgi:hypothetical protein
VNVTFPGRSVAGWVVEDLEVMAKKTSTTPRQTTRCRKHAFALSANFRPGNDVTANIIGPGQRPYFCSDRADVASGFAVANNNPTNNTDPTGLYSYQYFWDLGDLGPAPNVFDYFANHLHEVFPFPTGGCNRFYLGEHCDFHVSGTQDNLHVKELSSTSVTLEVDNWCQAGIPGLFCVAGDPPGSTIEFDIYSAPASVLGEQSCSGNVDVLAQYANAPGASFITNVLAPKGALFSWHQQAMNLTRALGGDPSKVKLITGPGMSTNP